MTNATPRDPHSGVPGDDESATERTMELPPVRDDAQIGADAEATQALWADAEPTQAIPSVDAEQTQALHNVDAERTESVPLQGAPRPASETQGAPRPASETQGAPQPAPQPAAPLHVENTHAGTHKDPNRNRKRLGIAVGIVAAGIVGLVAGAAASDSSSSAPTVTTTATATTTTIQTQDPVTVTAPGPTVTVTNNPVESAWSQATGIVGEARIGGVCWDEGSVDATSDGTAVTCVKQSGEYLAHWRAA